MQNMLDYAENYRIAGGRRDFAEYYGSLWQRDHGQHPA